MSNEVSRERTVRGGQRYWFGPWWFEAPEGMPPFKFRFGSIFGFLPWFRDQGTNVYVIDPAVKP